MPVFLSTQDADFETRFAALLGMKREEAEDVDAIVSGIIADVRARGDAVGSTGAPSTPPMANQA